MCTLFDEIAKENDILEKLQNKLGLSLQAAQEYMKLFHKQTI